MSAIVTLTPAPAAMEERLAALGVPVDRLIAAARIARSTWSAWRAGRTRPRADRWSAATAAFDALVAEATPAPLARDAAEPITLTGSSAPTGAPPSFKPIATASPETTLEGGQCRPLALAEGTAADPVEVLHAEWLARGRDLGFVGGDEDEVYGRLVAVEEQVVKSRATTVAGAITSLEWARSEFGTHRDEGILGDRLILALLDGALGVMKDSRRIIAVPEATADVAELTARWIQSASECERIDKNLDVIEDLPGSAGWQEMMEVARDRNTVHSQVLRAIADLRSTAVDVMALKAAALLNGRRGAEGLDREIAWDEPEVVDLTTSLALSLTRDVIALLAAPVQRLATAVEAGSVSTDLDASLGPLLVTRDAA